MATATLTVSPSITEIHLPDVSAGWSDLCREIVREAYRHAIVDPSDCLLPEDIDLSKWTGDIPELELDHLLRAASDVTYDPRFAGTTHRQMLEAIEEAARFIDLDLD